MMRKVPTLHLEGNSSGTERPFRIRFTNQDLVEVIGTSVRSK